MVPDQNEVAASNGLREWTVVKRNLDAGNVEQNTSNKLNSWL